MICQDKEKGGLGEGGATTVEYAIAIVALALAVFLVAGFLEASIASRVNSGRDCYTSVELQDPANTTGPCQ